MTPPEEAGRPRCVFCAIVAGEAEAHVVHEDGRTLAFLDHRPLFPGHTLVVPREHIEALPDLPAADLGAFFAVVQRIARVMPSALDAEGTFVANNNRAARAWRTCTCTSSRAAAATACEASSGLATPTRARSR